MGIGYGPKVLGEPRIELRDAKETEIERLGMGVAAVKARRKKATVRERVEKKVMI